RRKRPPRRRLLRRKRSSHGGPAKSGISNRRPREIGAVFIAPRAIGAVFVFGTRAPLLAYPEGAPGLKPLQVMLKRLAQIGALQRKLHCGLEEPQLIAGVVTRPFKPVSVDGLAPQQML